MLNPDQIATLKAGIANPSGISPTQHMDESAFNSWVNNKPLNQAPVAPVSPENKTSVLDSVKSGYKKYSDTVTKVAGDTFAPIEEAGKKVAETAKNFANGDQSLKSAAQAGFDTAGDIAHGAVGAISAPVADAIHATADFNAEHNPVVKKLAESDVVGAGLDALNNASESVRAEYAKFKANHPTAAKNAENTGDIASLLALFAGEKPVTDAVKSVATKAVDATKGAVEGTIDAVKPVVKETVETLKTKAAESAKLSAEQEAAARALKNKEGVEKLINVSEENMTPTMKKEAVDAGRQKITDTMMGKTKVEYAPTKETTRAAEILQDKNILKEPVSPKDKPNVVVQKIKDTIKNLGKGAETYLDMNPVKISNKEDFNLFESLRKDAEQISTETELRAYDEQVRLFQKQLLGREGGYTTANYYKALKEWESNIADKLPRGKEALMDATGVANAKIRAAADIRKVVRDLIGDKHPEFKPKMYDLMSLYEAKDNAILNAAKTKTKNIFEKHPNITKVGIGLGAGEVIHGLSGL